MAVSPVFSPLRARGTHDATVELEAFAGKVSSRITRHFPTRIFCYRDSDVLRFHLLKWSMCCQIEPLRVRLFHWFDLTRVSQSGRHLVLCLTLIGPSSVGAESSERAEAAPRLPGSQVLDLARAPYCRLTVANKQVGDRFCACGE